MPDTLRPPIGGPFFSAWRRAASCFSLIQAVGRSRRAECGVPVGHAVDHLTLRKALADAVEDRLLSHNPADGAHRLHRDRPEMKTWSAEQLSSFLGSVADDEHFCLWRLAATTGMRRGELLGLR